MLPDRDERTIRHYLFLSSDYNQIVGADAAVAYIDGLQYSTCFMIHHLFAQEIQKHSCIHQSI